MSRKLNRIWDWDCTTKRFQRLWTDRSLEEKANAVHIRLFRKGPTGQYYFTTGRTIQQGQTIILKGERTVDECVNLLLGTKQ